MTTVDYSQWCNHDTPAIDANGACECGARPRVFPTPLDLTAFLTYECGKPPREADAIAADLPSDGCWFEIDVSARLGHPGKDIRTVARVGGWYLVLPYRTDEAIRKDGGS